MQSASFPGTASIDTLVFISSTAYCLVAKDIHDIKVCGDMVMLKLNGSLDSPILTFSPFFSGN